MRNIRDTLRMPINQSLEDGYSGGRLGEGGREQAVDRAVRCAPSADLEDANLARVIQLLFGQVNFYIPNGIIT